MPLERNATTMVGVSILVKVHSLLINWAVKEVTRNYMWGRSDMPQLHWFLRMAGVSDSIALKVKDIMVSANVSMQMIALTINDRTVTPRVINAGCI